LSVAVIGLPHPFTSSVAVIAFGEVGGVLVVLDT
jgi:hypothetical protein